MALDMHELQYLTDTQKERYMLLQRLFESEYWPLLKQWADVNAAESAMRLHYAPTWDVNRVAFGAHAAYTTLANIEQSVDIEFANYAKEAAEAKSAEVEGEQET